MNTNEPTNARPETVVFHAIREARLCGCADPVFFHDHDIWAASIYEAQDLGELEGLTVDVGETDAMTLEGRAATIADVWAHDAEGRIRWRISLVLHRPFGWARPEDIRETPQGDGYYCV